MQKALSSSECNLGSQSYYIFKERKKSVGIYTVFWEGENKKSKHFIMFVHQVIQAGLHNSSPLLHFTLTTTL